MNRELLQKISWNARYILKQGTNSSYVYQPYLGIDALSDKKQKLNATAQMIARMQQDGRVMLLPFRVYFIAGDEAAPVGRSGRGKREKVAQMKAKFTLVEESPYKLASPYKVCTSIWQVEGRKCVFYGTIGITQAANQTPKDNGDLVVFYTPNWKEVDVFIFKGLVRPNDIANLQEAVRYVEDNVELG